MSQVLYRKYRPKDFSELVGQRHIVTAIPSSLKMGRVAHAYLFSGRRGVGKTSTDRLIAKGLNCLNKNKPCNECESCDKFNAGRAMNLIEIDAASNRSIDDIKELREGVRFAPAEGKYKVYIIDEVHQLSRDAFNALLKTLEEPPAHAVFILATTELDKVPATIISRTQHYDFHRPTVQQISGRLLDLAGRENIKMEKEAAHLIALAAEGSLRDAESILGQVIAVEDKQITKADVEIILGLPRREAARAMFAHIAQKDAPKALALIQDLSDNGYDLGYFSKLLMQYFRSAVFMKTDPALKKYIEDDFLPEEFECLATHLPAFTDADLSKGLNIIATNMQTFKKSSIPQLPLELTVIELINR